jgi:hypothetical protein
MTWLTTLLAIWGAGLSTALAWLEYRRDRPLTHILSDGFASKGLIDVSVENRGDAAIVVRCVRVLFGKEVDASIEDPARNQVFSLLGRQGRLVRAGESLTVTFHLPDGSTRRGCYFALISWRRLSGLAAPTVPLFIRLPRAELERLGGTN